MKKTFFSKIENFITQERLSVYRADGCNYTIAFSRYLFNMELCKELYACLNFFEISLRNSIDKALKDFTKRIDWENVIYFKQENKNQIDIAIKM